MLVAAESLDSASPGHREPSDGPVSLVLETITPEQARILLEDVWHGATSLADVVASYAQDMREGHWVLNGMPIVVSRLGVILDGVQRLRAVVAANLPLTTFVARGVADAAVYTLDQHRHRSFATALKGRGIADGGAVAALLLLLLRYDEGSVLNAAPPPSRGRLEHFLRANPGLATAVAESLAMADSPLPEAVRSAILYMGNQVDPTRTARLLEAVRHPDHFGQNEPGVLLRAELDRLRGTTGPHTAIRIFALAILALNAGLRGETPRQLIWPDLDASAGGSFPALEGYAGLSVPPAAARIGADDANLAFRATLAVMTGEVVATTERIDHERASSYLALQSGAYPLLLPHVDALARDIAEGRWLRNGQPICFSRSGALLNGRHRLAAVVAVQGAIEVPVIRGLPEAAHETYDVQARRRTTLVSTHDSFGDAALANAMANLLWRHERRGPTTRRKKAVVSEIRHILTQHPRLLELRGFGRRMVAFGRASVMGYAAYVIERDEPLLAPMFLKALGTGANLSAGHPTLALRSELQRLRGDAASQDEQLDTILGGWNRFKAYAKRPDEVDLSASASVAMMTPALRRPPAGVLVRQGSGRGISEPVSPPRRPPTVGRPSSADAETELRRTTRQGDLLVAFGRFALLHEEPMTIMREASRLAASGVNTRYSRVMELEADTRMLLVRAGTGWREGVVGHVRLPSDTTNPAGYAFTTGAPLVRQDDRGDPWFDPPRFLAEHGVRRGADVVIAGTNARLGCLAVDDTSTGTIGPSDVRFLEALAGMLGVAMERARAVAVRQQAVMDQTTSLWSSYDGMRGGLDLIRTVLMAAARHSASDSARQELLASALRAATIGTAHDRWRVMRGAEGISVRDYVTQLAAVLSDTLGQIRPGTLITTEVELGGSWELPRAQVLGLVLTELVLLAMSGAAGTIVTRLTSTGTRACLRVTRVLDQTLPSPGPRAEDDFALKVIGSLLHPSEEWRIEGSGQSFDATVHFTSTASGERNRS